MLDTPKNSQTSLRKTLSPIQLPQSPAAVSPQRNLVGYPRVVRDLAADTFNSIQHWNTFHIKGATIVKEISLLKCDNVNVHPEGLEPLCENLQTLVDSLRIIVDKLEGYCNQLHSLIQLNKVLEPLFLSWSMEKTYSVVRCIADSYVKDFQLKELVADNIPHIQGKDKLMFYAACWTYQPYITSETELLLESFLIETGHRNK